MDTPKTPIVIKGTNTPFMLANIMIYAPHNLSQTII